MARGGVLQEAPAIVDIRLGDEPRADGPVQRSVMEACMHRLLRLVVTTAIVVAVCAVNTLHAQSLIWTDWARVYAGTESTQVIAYDGQVGGTPASASISKDGWGASATSFNHGFSLAVSGPFSDPGNWSENPSTWASAGFINTMYLKGGSRADIQWTVHHARQGPSLLSLKCDSRYYSKWWYNVPYDSITTFSTRVDHGMPIGFNGELGAGTSSAQVTVSYLSMTPGVEARLVSDLTLNDLLDGSVQPSISGDGKTFRIVFDPQYVDSLNDAVRVLQSAAPGLDHFNWLNVVIYDDSPTRPTVNGTQPAVPYIDPPAGGWDYEQGIGGADNLPGYWDEGPGWTGPLSLGAHTSYNSLWFEDSPTVTLPGYSRAYRTYLLGVEADGTSYVMGDYVLWAANSLGVYDLPRNINANLVQTGDIMLLGIKSVSRLSEADVYQLRGLGIGVIIPEPPTITLAYLASRWLEKDCGESEDCGGADLDVSGKVDLTDFAIFVEHWAEGL